MIDYIEQDRAEGKPFFAYLAYTAPHWPLQAPKESIARFKGRYDEGYEALYAKRFARQKELGLVPTDAKPIDDARFTPRWSDADRRSRRAIEARRMEIYAAMVSDLDSYVGEVIAYLKKIGAVRQHLHHVHVRQRRGVGPARPAARRSATTSARNTTTASRTWAARNTYVMYGANWASVSATPFNRHKVTASRAACTCRRSCTIRARWPRGTRSDATGTVMDLLPTFLALAGAQHPGTQLSRPARAAAAGSSLLPVLYGQATSVHAADEVLGWELFGHRSVRQGDWKLVWDTRGAGAERRWQLFDLATDRSEQHDLSAANPGEVRRDAARLGALRPGERSHLLMRRAAAGRGGAGRRLAGWRRAGAAGAMPRRSCGRRGCQPRSSAALARIERRRTPAWCWCRAAASRMGADPPFPRKGPRHAAASTASGWTRPKSPTRSSPSSSRPPATYAGRTRRAHECRSRMRPSLQAPPCFVRAARPRGACARS